MSEEARILRPERHQARWEVVDLDSQLPPDHRARVVWQYVKTLDLSTLEQQIKARGVQPGRPASDPAVVLGLWLYATVDGVGSARAVERLCQSHAAYRWLCGGVPVNHNLLSEFRRDNEALLDRLLTQSLTALIAEGLIALEEVSIDGTKVRARAGRGSMAKRKRLEGIEAKVTERVASLKRELEQDGAGAERRRRERALRAAAETAARVQRAKQRLAELEQEKEQRARRRAKEEAKKAAPRVSVSDPEVRMMRMADGAVRPAWNVQVATAKGFIVAIEPTDRRNDTGLAPASVKQVVERCGQAPERLLADQTAMTQGDIAAFAEQHPKLEVYSPPPEERDDVTAETLRNRRSQRRHEPEAVKLWRARMASDEGKAIYAKRKFTEHVHAKLKNRGFGQMLVHGVKKVRVVCLLHALAHNLMQASFLRTSAAAAGAAVA
jgi:transposase